MRTHLAGIVGAIVLAVGPAMTSCREAKALQLADFDGVADAEPRRSPEPRANDPLGNRTGVTPGAGHATGVQGTGGSGARERPDANADSSPKGAAGSGPGSGIGGAIGGR